MSELDPVCLEGYRALGPWSLATRFIGAPPRHRWRSGGMRPGTIVSLALLLWTTSSGAPLASEAPAVAPAPVCAPALAAGDASPPLVGERFVSWEDQTPNDWIYEVATRFSNVDGHRVHYPTPPAELASLLDKRPEPDALRHLADARLALGDRPKALAALERWADLEGGWAWGEAAYWADEHREPAFALRAADRALPCLEGDEQRRLADLRVRWSDAHPELADPIEARRARAALFPNDGRALESWIRALENAGRLDDADRALAASHALSTERTLIVRSDLAELHHDPQRAFAILDAAVEQGDLSDRFRRAFVLETDAGQPDSPNAWRATLERRFDRGALIRLATYFQGQGHGLAAAELLRQVGARYETQLDREGWLTMARLLGEIDSVPEAFRARLSAARAGTPDQGLSDLVALSRLALRAGSRPLPWGVMNDESYKWVARIDRTPGFFTGGVSFLLTGGDWNEALENLEGQSLSERTFATARALTAELARRSPGHPELPSLQVAILERHVERGEGAAALALFAKLAADPKVSAEVLNDARRSALLAMRQVTVPLADEARLYRERLRAFAPDGSRPPMHDPEDSSLPSELIPPEDPRAGDGSYGSSQDREIATWGRPSMNPRPLGSESYRQVLSDALTRLEDRDHSHRASLELMLAELDRLPQAEELWLDLVQRLDRWNLDDDLGPRYEHALARFRGPGWWSRAARWYAKRTRHADLRKLADDLVARFRAAGIFPRTERDSLATGPASLEIPEQPAWGSRVRLVAWADWVRLVALQRFPHSPKVVMQAQGHLVRKSEWQRKGDARSTHHASVIVDDAFLDERQWALFHVDSARRGAWLDEAMRKHDLAARLAALESAPALTPVEDAILADGFSRLGHFERASAPADRLAAAFPADSVLVHRAMSLHRSLNARDATHAAPAHTLVERSVPASGDANLLLTELGELEEERGRPHEAEKIWRGVLELDPRDPKRIEELATLLWDYERPAKALEVIEDGRKRLGKPRLLAFEAGVLREELRDLDGAVREYLEALDVRDQEMRERWPFSSDSDDRAVRRLGTLLGRARPRGAVLERIGALQPGRRGDEEALVALLPLLDVAPPYESAEDREFLDWLVDRENLPHDPVGRAEHAAKREAARPEERAGATRVGEALLTKALAMTSEATSTELLDVVERWRGKLLDARWAGGREVALHDAVAARRADLATSDEERVKREIERAQALADQGRPGDADELWKEIEKHVEDLPEGAAPMHAWASQAAYLEKVHGVDAAAAAWARLSERYPWSAGVLEDRLAFLARAHRSTEARGALETTAARAAEGHREALFESLARECLDDRLGDPDPQCARRAALALVSSTWSDFDEGRRLSAFGSLARASFWGDPATDGLALVTEQAPRFRPEMLPDLYAEAARAADQQNVPATSVTLWIEALNRRTERGWIRPAARAATRAGQLEKLLGFFEKQRQRSPRDVRWALVVRELELASGDLDGAIRVAEAAVTVRPEKSELWTEAAELLARAGRFQEASDYLEGLAKLRPGDEEVTRLRGSLLARAGNQPGSPAAVAAAGERILALEKSGLDAFKRQRVLDDERKTELRDREARAARRMLGLGYPSQAWKLLAGAADRPRAVIGSALGAGEQADLALRAGTLSRLLLDPAADDSLRESAADVVASRARPEQKEALLEMVMSRAGPLTGGRLAPESAKWLEGWWAFVRAAGLEDGFRLALARKLIAASPGPWAGSPPFSFQQALAEGFTIHDGQAPWLTSPDLDRSWVEDLAHRDRPTELADYLAPRLHDLMTTVRSPTALPVGGAPLGWTRLLATAGTLDVWSRGLAARPAQLDDLADAFTDTTRWSRFLELGAKSWNTARLVALYPEPTRTAWFKATGQFQSAWGAPQGASTTTAEDRESISLSLGRLIAGTPDALADPMIAKLRGPRSVGEVLGHDPSWTWDREAGGAVAGAAGAARERSDALRYPSDLWGDRPGEAWYALEALSRLRSQDPSSIRVPFELADRGSESERSRLAARLASRLEGPSAALAVDAAHPPVQAQASDLEWRVRTLVAAGRSDDANVLLRSEIRRQQSKIGVETFRNVRRLCADLHLIDPLDGLDAASGVSPALVAYLVDLGGPALRERFKPTDVVSFRSALAERWRDRDGELDVARLNFWLDELWVNRAAELPRRGLAKLQGPWKVAGDWLASLDSDERAAGVSALRHLPGEPASFGALQPTEYRQWNDPARLVALWSTLAAGDGERALEVFDETLREIEAGTPPPTVSTRDSGSEGYEGEETEEGNDGALVESEGDEALSEAPSEAPDSADGAVSRIRAWLDVFQNARRERRVDRLADARAHAAQFLDRRADRGELSGPAWVLALELAPDAAGRGRVVERLEAAWISGDVRAFDLGPIVDALSRSVPEAAPRWQARWAPTFSFADAAARARVLARLGDRMAADRALSEARDRGAWSTADEVRAFDTWRGLSTLASAKPLTSSSATKPTAPAAGASSVASRVPSTWQAAAPFWREAADRAGADLGTHLAKRPFDLLAARAGLRSAGPAPSETMARAQVALRDRAMQSFDEAGTDSDLLRLRAMRGTIASSWRAADSTMTYVDPGQLAGDLARRRMKRADIDGALADLARLAAFDRDAAAWNAALTALEDRNGAEAVKVRAETRMSLAPRAPAPYRLDGELPRPYRPRDLDWSLVSGILAAEPSP